MATLTPFWDKPQRNVHHDARMNANHKRHKEAFPVCVICSKLFNLVRPATTTDHIKPLKLGGAKYDWNNLQSLCDPHTKQKNKHDWNDIRRGMHEPFTDWTDPDVKPNDRYNIF